MKKALIISLIHFLLSLLYDRVFFNYQAFNIVTIFINVIFFIVLIILWKKVLDIYQNKEKHKLQIKIFLIYFLVMMFFFLLTFPGVWRSDDLGLIESVKNFRLSGWQHIFSSIYYMLALKFIPMPGGIVIVQNVIISSIVSYLVSEEKRCILLLPFFLFPVIDNNLYTLRPVLYSYILLLAIYQVIKYYHKCLPLTIYQIIELAFYFFILATWRTEGIYYIFIYIFILVVFIKKQMLKKIFAKASIIIIVTLLIMTKLANAYCGGENTKYSLISVINPITNLIRIDKKQEKTINKVIDTNKLLISKSRGIDLYYNDEGIIKDYTKEEYHNLIIAYGKLILKNPVFFLSERTHEYLRANGFVLNIQNSTFDTTSSYIENILKNINGRFLLNFKLRATVIRILECRTINDYHKTTLLFPILWNSVLPTVIIVIASISMIFKKKYFEGIMISSVLIKTVIVILTAPDSFFMYYFAEYLIGYFILINFILKKGELKI